MVIATLMVGLPIGFLTGSFNTYDSYENGQMATWDIISNDENNLRDLYSNATQTALKQWLSDEPMNFTDGLIWESRLLNFSYDRPEYRNATQMIASHKGACGDFAWIYGAFCVAKNITFRIIHVGYWVPSVVDHSWVQVNPTKDGETWIHVEVAGSCDGIQKGKSIDQLWGDTIGNNQAYINSHYKMVLAYQLIDNQVVITDVTSTFA